MTVAKIPKGQKIAFAISCILPVGLLLLSVLLLLGDAVLNRTFLLGYFILPVSVILLLKLTIFSNLKVLAKVFISMLLLFFLAVGFFFITTVGKMELVSRYQNEEAIENYARIDSEYSCMPSLNDVGNPVMLEYLDYFSQQMIYFVVDVNALKCTYDASEYAKEKDSLEDNFFFQVEPVSAHEYIVEPTAEIDGYTFRMLSFRGEYENKLDYPKYMMFVATNDVTKEIIYLHYADVDLDFIENLSDFILYDCGWRHIRK